MIVKRVWYGRPSTDVYDNKACATFILHISKALEAKIFDKLRTSPWFGLMVDEATDVSVTKNLILYTTFVEGRQVRTPYLRGA